MAVMGDFRDFTPRRTGNTLESWRSDAEIVGYGMTCDAYMTAPVPNGRELPELFSWLKDAG